MSCKATICEYRIIESLIVLNEQSRQDEESVSIIAHKELGNEFDWHTSFMEYGVLAELTRRMLKFVDARS